jgi:hypothetical protein
MADEPLSEWDALDAAAGLTPPGPPPFDAHADAHPCEHAGCTLPGRFAIGIDEGAMRYWCLNHTGEGCAYLGALVRGIRDAIRRA